MKSAYLFKYFKVYAEPNMAFNTIIDMFKDTSSDIYDEIDVIDCEDDENQNTYYLIETVQAY